MRRSSLRTALSCSFGPLVAASAMGLLVCAGTAFGQPTQPEQSLRELLADFIHYTKIDQRDAAKAVGEALLAKGLTPGQWVKLIDDSGQIERFDEAVVAAQKQAELAGLASQMTVIVSQGRLALVRDPGEISKNIQLLTGNARGRLIGRERLKAAGEYAVPQLLAALLQADNVVLANEASQVLIELGRQAVQPLSVAIGKLPEGGQEKVARILGVIGYRAALPFLAQTREATASDPVRQACDAAIRRIAGVGDVGSPSTLHLALGQDYFAERSELTMFPAESDQLVWNYEPALGLFATPVATSVFHEACAMRAAEWAMTGGLDRSALALWVGSNLRREIQSPAGYDNPTYARDRRDANYYAVAAGAEVCSAVSAQALADRDTPLLRRAIAALEKNAGGQTLWAGAGGQTPLLESLVYPNRRVRYDAALALAAASPTQSFPGSDRVIPTLASATREASTAYAIVVASDAEQYQGLRRIAEGQGYKVLADARSLSDLAAQVAELPGIDLIISSLPGESTLALIEESGSSRLLSATPVLAITSSQAAIELSRQFVENDRVSIRASGISESQIAEAAKDLVLRASGGPITQAEARDYQMRAIGALRDLAVSGSTAFDLADATMPLIAGLPDATGILRLEMAEVLARINDGRAQQAVMEAAMASQGQERVALLSKVGASAKRFGNLLNQAQVDGLIDLATSTSGSNEEATAAAAVIGALNLPNERLLPVIFGTSK